MRITALAGGVGGARFIRGLVHELRETRGDEETEVVVIGNTGDDISLFGLRICPDLDTILYTLGGVVNESQGWGRQQETHVVQGELADLGVQPQWFGLGDRDFATHIARSQWLGQGQSLSQITDRLAGRWGLPRLGVRLLPATDTPIETHVVLDDGEAGERAVHFQQWWVQMQAAVPARRFTVAGLAQAVPAPGVLEALRTADVILLPPSNPVVSIGIILGVPGIRDALRGSRAPVVGVSPIIGGSPVRGHADACLAALDVEVSAAGVAGLYADFLDGWLVDVADGGTVQAPRVEVRNLDLRMRDVEGAARIAGAALDLATHLAAGRPA
ncbi:MAG TPA: 2-phospho-L-lactate transferase [Ornithinicoccus sp.]|nr:2-phospho-L-lactate transferase [Ornithinicoccus sp.]